MSENCLERIILMKNNNNFKLLIDDCRGILTEGGFLARMSRVQVYYTLGGRISEDIFYKKHKKGNKELIKRIANQLQTSHRLLYYAIKFYKKFPDLDLLPEGKDISWTQIVAKYLTTKKEKKNKELTPDIKCPFCNKWFVKN